jgi:hypothetical protein
MAAHGGPGLIRERKRRRMGSRIRMCTTKEEKRQLLPLGSPGRVKRKRREEKISVGSDLAATTLRPAGSSGRRGTRARTQQREGNRARTGKRRRVCASPAGGGRRRSGERWPGERHRR